MHSSLGDKTKLRLKKQKREKGVEQRRKVGEGKGRGAECPRERNGMWAELEASE